MKQPGVVAYEWLLLGLATDASYNARCFFMVAGSKDGMASLPFLLANERDEPLPNLRLANDLAFLSDFLPVLSPG
jgi:hypothetical protein